MPDVFWPIFRFHRHLQHDLPALGAEVLQHWAWRCYGARLYIIVVQHTFGGHLNHNPHLHIMVSAGGLDIGRSRWIKSLKFDRDELMALWRLAVTMYLSRAHSRGLLINCNLPDKFPNAIHQQAGRRWNIHISRVMSKRHFLRYAGRYIRRLPISQRRILKLSETEILYQSKDTRTETLIETHSTPAEFMALIAQHAPDRYRHSMRYFGLLAPRTKRATSEASFHLLGQSKRPRPPRLSWRHALLRDFQTDPLRDSNGNPMKWVRDLKPSADDR